MREKIYNNRQWLERFKQHKERKEKLDIGPLIKEETITQLNGLHTKEKMQKKFFGQRDPKQHIK